jgi:arabinan endo-1,5-alpha-L-arabinosidase
MPRRSVVALALLAVMSEIACSASNSTPATETLGGGPNQVAGGSSNRGSTSGGAGSGGVASQGGATAEGGTLASGGRDGTIESSPAGGATRSGTGGSNATGGTPVAGGVTFATGGTSTGGTRATGGTISAGAALAIGGVSQSGGTKATGGLANVGGTNGSGAATTSGGKASAGATATGGAATAGAATAGVAGATSGDRCDVGVYDSASPPKALTLSGSLGAHDPSAVESNGIYYLFATGLGAKTSNNLTTWQDVGRPFAAPAWASASVPGVTDLWAPDISYFGGKYHLYYSASTFGSNRSCIGQATRSALNSGSWADQGSIICSNVDTSDNWNAIDPNVIVDTSGKPWLVFGSFWSGIKIIQLDDNGARVGTTVTAIADRPSNGGAIEGPFMIRRCNYYYLFASWDTCCKGASSTYNIRVGRSTSVTGPFADKAGTALLKGGGTLIAETGGSWAGPGGQSVLFAGNRAYLVYHAYAISNGNATLRVADLVWDSSGWPMPVGP